MRELAPLGSGAPYLCVRCTLPTRIRGGGAPYLPMRAVGCCKLQRRSTPQYRLLCAGLASPKGMPMWDLSGIWSGV